jgi:fructose-bisphosphate aldolase class II
MKERIGGSHAGLADSRSDGIILIPEIEAGVVGGEEDGIKASASAKLYTTPEDTLEVARRLNTVSGARYLLAATFGNVHGVYKPGHVKLKPSILKDCQDAVVGAFGEAARFYLVFHGGSGSELRDIHEAVDYGVVKMNVDTDMQYAFTRAIADHFFKNYDGVLKVDGEVGGTKAYDPRSYLARAEAAVAERVKQAANELRSVGTTMIRCEQSIRVPLRLRRAGILFAIGGDGTLRGAQAIGDEATWQGLQISVVGIPKTIDNDISFT